MIIQSTWLSFIIKAFLLQKDTTYFDLEGRRQAKAMNNTLKEIVNVYFLKDISSFRSSLWLVKAYTNH
jgi:hypothetical protein